MFFIGSGSLLYAAVDFALCQGHAVDGVCCPPGDSSGRRLEKRGVTLVFSSTPNVTLPRLMGNLSNQVVFSVNNSHILSDILLRSGPRFFNIHNGLVQGYRGLAEVCIVAALCHGETRYGATLQEVLPQQKVDAGPVIAQLDCAVGQNDGFAELLPQSLNNCQRLFELHLDDVLMGRIIEHMVPIADRALSYENLSEVLAACHDPARLTRAARLGPYAGFFPRLHAALRAV
jgi:methionyl-tRNA formyltransferase